MAWKYIEYANIPLQVICIYYAELRVSICVAYKLLKYMYISKDQSNEITMELETIIDTLIQLHTPARESIEAKDAETGKPTVLTILRVIVGG